MSPKAHSSVTLRIRQDSDPENPRGWSNLGTMVCSHRRYRLGDEQNSNFTLPPNSLSLPLYLLDHSGLRLNTTGFSACDPQRWDWGQLGVIWCAYDDLKMAYSAKRVTQKLLAQGRKALILEVQALDHFLSGSVWGYDLSIEGHPEQGDSCWGFFGSTLEETGILHHLARKYHKLAAAAWEQRS